MFNVAVINIKDLIKYLVGLIITIAIIVISTKYFLNSKKEKISQINITNKIKNITQENYAKILNKTIPEIEEINNSLSENEKAPNIEKTSLSEEKLSQRLLQVELGKIDQTTENSENAKEAQTEEKSNAEENKNIEEKQQEVAKSIETEVVTPEPIDAKATDTYGTVQIRNQTNYTLTEEMLTPDIEVDKSNIIIFHTHTCESYTPTEQNQYEASGNFRTTDLNYSVARVGDELEQNLKNYGLNVIHDRTYHDFPAYTGSYSRSLKTVEALIQQNPADLVIDLHRDAIGSNSSYAPTLRINEDYCAQLMFVIGTDGGGLNHPNWNQNLKFAIKVQQKADEMYPGLFKPLILRNSRYNQHVAKCANIIEVGATGNTLEQCITSMKYLADVLKEVI